MIDWCEVRAELQRDDERRADRDRVLFGGTGGAAATRRDREAQVGLAAASGEQLLVELDRRLRGRISRSVPSLI